MATTLTAALHDYLDYLKAIHADLRADRERSSRAD
jgi:hypothetical protein